MQVYLQGADIPLPLDEVCVSNKLSLLSIVLKFSYWVTEH